jgi:hypothetical protein
MLRNLARDTLRLIDEGPLQPEESPPERGAARDGRGTSEWFVTNQSSCFSGGRLSPRCATPASRCAADGRAPAR